MKIIRNDQQKENLAKLFWDIGKVMFTILVITPFAKPEFVDWIGIFMATLVAILTWILGFIIDGREVQK